MRRTLAISLLIFSVLASATVASMLQTWSVKNTMTVVEATIFDTGRPLNPYPSIFGVHRGEIKPNKTIKVSRLYTYPCEGTGGHTEHIRIWNESGVIAEANWTGYTGDWHNITFEHAFTLEAGKTYNYEIVTGSYPQIHHTRNLSTPAGYITCTEFVNANGIKYNNMIPAIKFY